MLHKIGKSGLLSISLATTQLLFVEASIAGTPAQGESTAIVFTGAGHAAPPQWFIPPFTDFSRPSSLSILSSGFEARPEADGYILRFPGQPAPIKPGCPDLPVSARVMPGISGYRMEVVVTNTAYQDFTNVVVVPSETIHVDPFAAGPSPAVNKERIRAEEIYSKAEFWPSKLVDVQEAWMGTQKLVRVECHPIQYNPVSQTIRFHTKIECGVYFISVEP